MFHEEALFSKTWNRRTSRWAFLRALVVAFEELTTLGMNPSKTEWATHHAYFNKNARPRMLAEWSKITDLDPSLFPWQDDEVGTTWEEWRKTNEQYRGAYREQLGFPAAQEQAQARG